MFCKVLQFACAVFIFTALVCHCEMTALTDTSELGSGSGEGSAMMEPIQLIVEPPVITKKKLPRYIKLECRVAGWDPEVSLEYLSTLQVRKLIVN